MSMFTLFWAVQSIILTIMVVAGIFAITSKDLLKSVIGMGAFSLLLSLEFYILQAPDVAIAEAAIGAGLTTAIYIAAIRNSKRFEEEVE